MALYEGFSRSMEKMVYWQANSGVDSEPAEAEPVEVEPTATMPEDFDPIDPSTWAKEA